MASLGIEARADIFDFGKRVSWTQTGLLTAMLKHATGMETAEIRKQQQKQLERAIQNGAYQWRNGWCKGKVEKAIRARVYVVAAPKRLAPQPASAGHGRGE